jgi:hypothetical protein
MNFLACDREQPFLMPPDPRDWLPEGHLAWFVLASVEEVDPEAFYGSYRQDGWDRAAFEPGMMVAFPGCELERGPPTGEAGEEDNVLRAATARAVRPVWILRQGRYACAQDQSGPDRFRNAGRTM